MAVGAVGRSTAALQLLQTLLAVQRSWEHFLWGRDISGCQLLYFPILAMWPKYPTNRAPVGENGGAGLAQGTELGMDFTAGTPVPLWDTRSQPQKMPCPCTAALAHV